MTRQQKFEALVADCVRMNDPRHNPDSEEDDAMDRFESTVYKLGVYVWDNAHRVTIASEPKPKKRGAK